MSTDRGGGRPRPRREPRGRDRIRERDAEDDEDEEEEEEEEEEEGSSALVPRFRTDGGEARRASDYAEACRAAHDRAAEARAPAGDAAQAADALEIGERLEDLADYYPAPEAPFWSFAGLFWLARWTRMALGPHRSSPPEPGLAACPSKASGELRQSDVADALAALRLRWRSPETRPEARLWLWLEALDRRLAELCCRADAAEALDEAAEDLDGEDRERNEWGARVASEDFVADCACTLAEAWAARAVASHLARACPIRERAPPGLPVEGFAAWARLGARRATPGSEAKARARLAEHRLRPGEVDRYARAHLGVVPSDLEAVLLHCRPPLSDPEADASGAAYFALDRACERLGFPWADMSLLLDRRYFARSARGGRNCDVMLRIRHPTVLRVVGAHYVAAPPRLWECGSAEEAACLWVRLVDAEYETQNAVWDLRFLKKLYASWERGGAPPGPRRRVELTP
jgi:hypothetical protein